MSFLILILTGAVAIIGVWWWLIILCWSPSRRPLDNQSTKTHLYGAQIEVVDIEPMISTPPTRSSPKQQLTRPTILLTDRGPNRKPPL